MFFPSAVFSRLSQPARDYVTDGKCRENPQDAIGDEVVSEIIAATGRGPTNQDYGVGGHEAFTSIVFSPKVRSLS